MKESVSKFKKMVDKPFKRAGFQSDGTYIQEVSRKTPDKTGHKSWLPPKKGQKIITRQGPLKISNVIETFEYEGNKYFRAEGELVNQR